MNFLSSNAQDATEILQKSWNKCQTIKNGYYEMTSYMKYMDNKDTVPTFFKCYFQKLKDDSIYSSAFHYQSFWKMAYSGDVMYTGDEFVYYSTKDSSGTIMKKSLWAEDISASSHNQKFYSLFTNKKSSPLPHDSDFIDGKRIFKYLGVKNLNGINCYHVQVNRIPENEPDEDMQTIRIEYQYWIKKDDYLPFQYTIAFDNVMANDTQYQYEKIVLNTCSINSLNEEPQLKLSSIPSNIKLKDYVPYTQPELLPNDTIAPNWTLPSLTNENISLSSLKGQLVLIDFFYKGCYPCMQAIPGLQALHEKYKDKGLHVIGIDPYDKIEDGIVEFLAKRGVTYTILAGGKDVLKDYRISGYPTMYLIDRNGKVIFSNVGYGKTTEERLENVIKDNL